MARVRAGDIEEMDRRYETGYRRFPEEPWIAEAQVRLIESGLLEELVAVEEGVWGATAARGRTAEFAPDL